MRNEGFNIEYDIVNTINGKKFIDLPHNLYHMVKEIFGKLDDSKMIFAYRVDGFKKSQKSNKKARNGYKTCIIGIWGQITKVVQIPPKSWGADN